MKSQEWMKVFQDNFILGDRAASQTCPQMFFIYYSFFAKKVVRLTHPAVAKGMQPVGGCQRLTKGCHDEAQRNWREKGTTSPAKGTL